MTMEGAVEERKQARVTVKDLAYTNPGTIAGRYMRSFWQPIFEASKLPPGRAVTVQVMGEGWTLYRGETGTFHLVGERCAHRHAKLAVGWVEGDEIRCFYHGWKYGPTGECVQQPAEPKPFCHRIRLRSAPVKEYLGLVFAYFGEGEPSEFPRYPEFENKKILALETKHAFNYFNSIDNLLDATHLGFVHSDHAGGFDGRTDSPTIEAAETAWGASSRHARPSGKVGHTQFGMPNIFRGRIFPLLPNLPTREILIWFVPMDDESNHRFYVEANDMSKEEFDTYLDMRKKTFGGQTRPAGELAEAVLHGEINRLDVDPRSTAYPIFVDDVALIAQGRITDRTSERLGASDVGVLEVRRIWLRELKALKEGRPLTPWRYDPTLPLMQADEE
ncbi:MAG TPA: Rieske 2Fe-2S domain-containing protein [Stellaceae bacterium]|nr:Rieske 2Fe-2S domain-containing protein [Stellaceae bacterium]